jgi:D-inositol-3-phosphate glycosyltransferase
MQRSIRGRVAFLSLHTSPLDQPGTGDSGGMNVYIRTVAEHLSRADVAVDVYTRCAGRGVPEVEEVGDLFRVIQLPAGPCAPVDKVALPELVPTFTDGFLRRAAGDRYDLVHSHYWLSGWAAREASRRWDVPLVATFHTLGRVKNLALASGEAPEPRIRLQGEESVIREADRILAATPTEAGHLHDLYEAPTARIRLVPPGVDTTLFRPLDRAEALARLGLSGSRVVLFAGRLQPLKAPDVAIRAFAEAVRRLPSDDLTLVLVGGPSGDGGARRDLVALAAAQGVGDRVVFLPPRPHAEMPWIYASADVLLMPSRSESFGLVALEAQACGIPVVAASVGGLRHVIREGSTGFLVPGDDPAVYAERLLRVLTGPGTAAALSRGAVAHAAGFPWESTAWSVLSVYAELVPQLGPDALAGASA